MSQGSAESEVTEERPGRCFSCAFLSKRAHGITPPLAFYELGWHDRREGALLKQADPNQGDVETIPWCYRLVPDFYADLYAQTKKKGRLDRQGALEVIKKERRCPKWELYEIDRSPKEHLQKVEMLELQEKQQQFQEMMELRRREWEDKREQQRMEFEERLAGRADKAEERRHTLVLWIAGAAVILAFAEVTAAVLGAGPESVFGKLLGLD